WLTLLCFALASTAWAQPYPSRPIRVIVPFVPGGNVDITARTVAPALGDALGQPVVVENRPGAAGMVGAQAMISSPADGYTLMMGSNSSLAVAPNLYASWPYDPIKGIAPISNLAITPFVLVVRLGLPAQSLAEFVKLAKEKPGRLSMASGGNGSSNHLVGELFQMMTGLKLSHVPYKGTGAVGPAGMPLDAVARVHAAAVKALATPQVRERFASLGVQPVGDTPEQFGALIREDLARWSRVIKSAGVKVE